MPSRSHLDPIAFATSLVTTTLRFGAGVATRPRATRPALLLELYEFENCPFCRIIREVLTELDLDALIRPCPKGGARFRNEIINAEDVRDRLMDIMEEVVVVKVREFTVADKDPDEWEKRALADWVNLNFPLGIPEGDLVKSGRGGEERPVEGSLYDGLSPAQFAVSNFISEKVRQAYELKISFEQPEALKAVERYVVRDNPRRLELTLTLTDPVTFTKPLVVTKTWLYTPDVELVQDTCNQQPGKP